MENEFFDFNRLDICGLLSFPLWVFGHLPFRFQTVLFGPFLVEFTMVWESFAVVRKDIHT